MTPARCLILTSMLSLANAEAVVQTKRSGGPSVLTMEVTAYCVEGETASGKQTRRGIVAADPAVLPLGSVIRVRGLRRPHNRNYRVEDTGRKVKGRLIDIFMDDCRAATKFGRQQARVWLVARGSGSGSRP